MQKKLLTTYILIITVTVFVTVIISWNSINNHFYNQVEKETEMKILLIKQVLEYEIDKEDFEFQQFAENYGKKTDLRITIIDNNGNVLGDTDYNPSEMENHRYREEFKGALQGEYDTSLRYSNTLKKYMFYAAKPIEYDGFIGAIRVAIPVKLIEELIWDMVNSIFIGLFIGVVLSVGIAFVFTRKIINPINELTKTAKKISNGEYDNKVYIDNKDQIGELAEAFNTMTFTMRKNIWDMQTQNAELEAILTSMDIGLAAIDNNYKIILSNKNFSRLLDVEEDISNKIFYEVSRNPILFHVIEKSIDEDEFITEETRIKHNDKELILNISATPIKNKTNFNIRHGVLLLIEDITNLRKLENMRSDFVSNVTHELKTPLTSIKGFVEVLKKGDIEDPKITNRFLEIIDIESDRLTLLIEDILSLSEIENMRLDKKTGNFIVENIVFEVIEMLQGEADIKGIELKLDIQQDMRELKCDKNRIKQLFINLLDNAIKYTEKGNVTIECKQSRDNQFLTVNISDTGIGIKEEHLERLFERFYRVDKGRSRKLGGTGLGLSIVKHIIELYDGTIEVKSEYKKGTTIKLRIPFDNNFAL